MICDVCGHPIISEPHRPCVPSCPYDADADDSPPCLCDYRTHEGCCWECNGPRRPMIRYVSLFSGAGGWDLGCDAAGWECVAQVEWDPWATSVLERHWPDVARFGDISEVDGGELPPADVVCFGSPCTDLSAAGARAGLDGDASKMFYEAIRVIREMRDGTAGPQLRAVVWENVAGALSSSSGRDFGRVLDELAALGAVDVEWRLVDGLAFGPPQRRTRVFVVARFDSGAGGGCPVFVDREGVRGDSAPLRAEGEGAAAGVGGGPDLSHRSEFVGALTAMDGWERPDNAHAEAAWLVPEFTTAVTAKWAKGTSGPAGDEHHNLVPLPFVKTHHATSTGDHEVWEEAEVAQAVTVHTRNAAAIVDAFSLVPEGGQGADLRATAIDTSPALTATEAKKHDRGVRIVSGLGVRRLTPRECERLMGWPDDHTRWTADGRQIVDSHRYRMCGNGVMAPMGEWVARRITAALEEPEPAIRDTPPL